jgi:cystathionine beta-lyase
VKTVFTDHAHVEKGAERVLPMWVADMDFRVAPPIISALQERIDARGFRVYQPRPDSYYAAVIDWFQQPVWRED